MVAAGMVAITARTGGAMKANRIAMNVLVLGLVTMEEEAVSRSVEEQLTLPVPQMKLVKNSCGAQREIIACIALHMAEVETLVTWTTIMTQMMASSKIHHCALKTLSICGMSRIHKAMIILGLDRRGWNILKHFLNS